MAEFFKSKIFNLAENEIDFESFTKFSLLLFKMVCFDFEPLKEGATLRVKFVYGARMLIAILCLASCPVAILQLIVYIATSNDFMSAASAVQDALSILLVTIKAAVTFAQKEKIWEILMDMKALYEPRRHLNEVYKVKSYLDQLQRLIKVGAAIFLSSLMPVIFTIFPFVFNGTMKLTANFWFPFDVYQSETFPIASLWIDWITSIGLVFLLASDSLLYALISTLSLEFDILKIELLKMPIESKILRKENIIRLTARHNRLLSLSDKLQNVYSASFFGSFAVSSIIMCICAFQLSTGDNDIAAYMLYVPYFVVFSGQVLLLCIFGQKLSESSLGVAKGIYESNWMDDDDNDNKKQIVLIILRAQKPKQLNAMQFAKVSLESFATVSHSLACE